VEIKRAIQSGDHYPQAMKRAIITSVLTLLSADVVDYAFRDTNLWFLVLFGVRNFQLYLPFAIQLENTAYGYKVFDVFVFVFLIGEYFRVNFLYSNNWIRIGFACILDC
jgi:hypothetical protein